MENATSTSLVDLDLRGYIRDLPDYPSAGITFRDITPLLVAPQALSAAIEQLAALVPAGTELIAGMEARGFIFGAALAQHMGLGFVPIRKAGKLPPPVKSFTYDLEYGQATVELRDGTVSPGAKVVLLDDVLATGGTAEAGAELLEQVGAEVVRAIFLLELAGLSGRERLAGRAVSTLMVL
ncbi:adenine phosphoribosyltransferase [Jonesiaceae bacterium BS-20]|uniref:Adenine phosphoribosyltransferase n=1 Tax=Jonesiaceae bacterium BS-20 TaxID=3120821 RepID=A0AAU7DYD3_9MICO